MWFKLKKKKRKKTFHNWDSRKYEIDDEIAHIEKKLKKRNVNVEP